MRMNTLARAMVGVGSLLLLPGIVLAGSPTEWVQDTVIEVKNTLGNQGPGVSLSREKLNQFSRVIDERFHFPEMARLALGRHWRKRSPEERKEFVGLFRDLLKKSQFMKMATKAQSEQRYIGERIEGKRTIVQAIVVAEDAEIPVDYHLIRQNGSWMICDLGIDGMRLSQIYRAQFNRVISKGSYKDLVRRMQNKLQEVAYETTASR